MFEFQLSLRIERPPEEVFSFWEDPERIRSWQVSAEDVRVEGEPGPGRRWTVERKILGTRQAVRSRWTAWEPGRRLVEESEAGPARTTIETRFVPEGGGTRVETRVQVELGGALGRLGEKVARGPIKKQAEQDQARIKGLIEGA